MGNILYIVGAVIVAIWLLGTVLSIGGHFIHLLLVVAVIVFLYQFLTGRRSV